MQLEALWELLPPTLEAATPQLLYSSNRHGYALQRMFEQCDRANGHALNHGAIDHAGVPALLNQSPLTLSLISQSFDKETPALAAPLTAIA